MRALLVATFIAWFGWSGWLVSLPAPKLRRDSRASRPQLRIDRAVVLDLLGAAIGAGASTPTALVAVAQVLPTEQGMPLHRAAKALQWGVPWEQAWNLSNAAPSRWQALFPTFLARRYRATPTTRLMEELSKVLRSSWELGVDPTALLNHAASKVRRDRRGEAKAAAARLAVRLVLPLGLCLLPAFVLIAVVPLVFSTGLGVLSILSP